MNWVCLGLAMLHSSFLFLECLMAYNSILNLLDGQASWGMCLVRVLLVHIFG